MKNLCLGPMPWKDAILMYFVIKLLFERKLYLECSIEHVSILFSLYSWYIPVIQRNISVHAVIVYFSSFNKNFFSILLISTKIAVF